MASGGPGGIPKPGICSKCGHQKGGSHNLITCKAWQNPKGKK